MEIRTEVFGVNVTCNAGVGAGVTFAPKLFRSGLFGAGPGTREERVLLHDSIELVGYAGVATMRTLDPVTSSNQRKPGE